MRMSRSKLYQFILQTLIVVGSVSHAQTSSESTPEVTAEPKVVTTPESNIKVIRYAGTIQFADGDVARVEGPRLRTPLAHRSTIYEGERLSSGKKSIVKIVTRGDCILVIYGESQILAPNMEMPWRIQAESLRWICPEGSKVTFRTRNLDHELESGEVLIDRRRLLVLKGKARGGETTLSPRKIYKFDGNIWIFAMKESTDANMYSLNKSQKPPKESTELPPPPPPRIKDTRFILGPVGAFAQSAKYDVDDLNKSGLDGGGFRLQVHRKAANAGSWIAALSFIETNEKNQNYVQNVTPPNGVSSQIKTFAGEFGYRFQHERYFSTYVRSGIAQSKAKINVSQYNATSSFAGGYGSDTEYEFYMLTLAAGVDAFYSPGWLDWLGIYAAIEANAARSLFTGTKTLTRENINPSNGKPSVGTSPTSLTTFGGAFMLGLMIQY